MVLYRYGDRSRSPKAFSTANTCLSWMMTSLQPGAGTSSLVLSTEGESNSPGYCAFPSLFECFLSEDVTRDET